MYSPFYFHNRITVLIKRRRKLSRAIVRTTRLIKNQFCRGRRTLKQVCFARCFHRTTRACLSRKQHMPMEITFRRYCARARVVITSERRTINRNRRRLLENTMKYHAATVLVRVVFAVRRSATKGWVCTESAVYRVIKRFLNKRQTEIFDGINRLTSESRVGAFPGFFLRPFFLTARASRRINHGQRRRRGGQRVLGERLGPRIYTPRV